MNDLIDDIILPNPEDSDIETEDLIISNNPEFNTGIVDPIDEVFVERNPFKKFLNKRKKVRNKNRLRMIKESKQKNRK